MKHKQLFGLFAASALFCVGTVVQAEERTNSGTITIKSTNNIPLDKEQFLTYRMLDAERISDKEEKYTIISEWQDFFNKQVPNKDGHDCTGSEAQEYLLKLQTNPKNFKAFKKAAYEYAKDKQINDLGIDSKKKDSYTISGLPNGYYIIIQEDLEGTVSVSKDMLVTVDAVNKDVSINLKADVPSLIKTINETGQDDKKVDTYNIGDTVPFRLVSKVPDMSGYMSATGVETTGRYVFEVYEKMSKGLTLDPNSIHIKVGSQEYKNFKVVDVDNPLTEEKEWRIVFGTDTKFNGTLDIEKDINKDLSDKDGVLSDEIFKNGVAKPIIITYNATLNENAVLGGNGNPNTANVKYSSNPYKKEDTNHTWDSTAKAYSFGLDITKENSKGTKLKDAEFTLKKDDSDNTQIYVKPLGNNDGHYVVCKSDDKGAVATIKTDSKGKLYIDGLKQGDYQLVETKAPAGYKLLTEPIKFNINAEFSYQNKSIESTLVALTTNGKGFATNKESGYLSTKIVNVTGGLLPKTGGRGAIMFIVAGVAVITGATVVTLKSRKKSA